MTFFPIVPPGGVSGPPVLTFTDSVADATNGSTYTFTNRAIGTASDFRMVVVAFSATEGGSGAGVFSSATIGGIAADLIVQDTDSDRLAMIIAALVPTGTTATIVVNLTNGKLRAGIAVYSVTNRTSTTAFATSTDSGFSDGTTELAVPANGCVVVAAACNNSAAMTTTGVTENFDALGETDRLGAGSLTGQSANPALAISMNNGTAGMEIAAASWGSQA